MREWSDERLSSSAFSFCLRGRQRAKIGKRLPELPLKKLYPTLKHTIYITESTKESNLVFYTLLILKEKKTTAFEPRGRKKG